MTLSSQGQERQEVGFLLVPKFSMIALVGAVECMRLANRLSGRELYQWSLLTEDGAPVSASSGIQVGVDAAIGPDVRMPFIYVCAGLDVQETDTKANLAWLRRLSSHGSTLGALCTGSYLLAKAGLLTQYRCTIHWENLPGLRQDFPELDLHYELFEIDRDRHTCAGGTASIDMMLYLIREKHGQDLAVSVSEQLLHERIRDAHDHQRMALQSRLGISHPKLLEAISKMEDNIEEPLTFGELAREIGLSTRQLERLFRKYLDRTPTRFYLELRLERARLLLTQTTMSVIGVAMSCGFLSPSHFSKCYREFYGRTPREERGRIRFGRGVNY